MSVQASRYFAMPWREAWFKVVFIAILTILATIILQVMWPQDRLIPGQKINGVSVGGETVDDVTRELNDRYSLQTIRIAVNGDMIDGGSLASLNIAVDATPQVASATNYPWWQRLIPGSFIVRSMNNEVDKDPIVKVNIVANDGSNGEGLKRVCTSSATNASLLINGEAITLKKAKSGMECDIDELASDIAARPFRLGVTQTFSLNTKMVEPKIRTEKIRPLYNAVSRRLANGLVISSGGKEFTVRAKEIVKWISFTTNGAGDNIKMVFNDNAIRQFIDTNVRQRIVRAAGVTKVKIIDGAEAKRTKGADGKDIDYARTISSIHNVFLSNTSNEATLSIKRTAPRVEYSYSYSKTSTGLNTLLADSVSGRDYAIAVVTKDGNISGAFHADKVYTAASTYKLFVAYSMIKRVESGTMNWMTQIKGQSLGSCFEKMIVQSDNACPQAFLAKISFAAAQADARSIGASSTQIVSGNMRTTARDLATFLTKLNNGSLMNHGSYNRLISAMKRQIFRQGIPKGTGRSVADKVGFLDGLLHDAGIVYGNKTYILVIMSNGQSWAGIADIASKVDNHIN